MTSFLEKKDPWGHGMSLWVLLGMVFLIPIGIWALSGIGMHNDVENWLPADDPQSQILSWYHGNFPPKNRIIVSWKGSSLTDPRVLALADKLEGKLGKDGTRRGGLPYVDDVLTPHKFIAKMQTSSSGDISQKEAIKRIEGVFVGPGLLKIQLTEAGRERHERVKQQAVEQIQSQLDLSVEVVKSEEELFAEMNIPEKLYEELPEDHPEFPPTPEHDFQLSWKGMHSSAGQKSGVTELLQQMRGPVTAEHPEGKPWVEKVFLSSGSPVAMFVTLSDAGGKEPREAMAAIRAAAAELGIPEEDFHMGGRSVAGSELNAQVKRAAWNRAYPITQFHKRSPILLSALVSMILAFVMLRSIRLAVIVLTISYYTTFIAVAIVPITNGSMNMVLVVMPTLLSVLTTSAAIHVANYWKHAAERNLKTAVIEAVKMAKQPCLLAGLTTAVGLISLTASPLRPVRDFGFYSAIGCLVSLVAVLVCLPALLLMWPAPKPTHREVEHTFWKSLSAFLFRYRMSVITVSVVGFAVCTYGLTRFRMETKVIRYFPDHARVVQDYNFLEENLAGIVPVDVVVRFDESMQKETDFLDRLEIVRHVEKQIRDYSEISGTVSLADFQGVRKPFFVDPNASNLQKIMRKNARVAKSNRVEEEVKSGGSASSLMTVAKVGTQFKGPDGRDIVIKKGDELWRITAQVAIMSDLDYSVLTKDLNDRVKNELKLHAGSDHVVTGMVPVFLRTQQAVLESLIQSFGLAFIIIAFVMMIVLKNPLAGLISMLPNLLPIGVVFGLISWAELPVDIGTMITASVALGIAVDGTLHLLTWFRNGLLDGLSRQQAVEKALMHCGPAMWQTSAAVGLGLLMLFPAELLLIHRFGWLMASLIGTALIADAIFLPALLAGPLGYIIERSVKKTAAMDVMLEEQNMAESSTVPSLNSASMNSTDLNSADKVNPLIGPPNIIKLNEKSNDGSIFRVD